MTIAQVNAVCSEVYGAGILAIDSTAALWVAERIMKDSGRNVYRLIYRHRAKYGINTAFPSFGTPLFTTM